jgi:glutathione S-transferase
MDETIILYAEPHWDSPWVFTAFVALREKALPFEARVVDLDRGEQREKRYQERSLTGRVPCIEHQGFVLSESLAIVEYLDERFPAPQHPAILPSEVRDRARARQILGWLRSDLLPLRDERPTTTMFFDRAKTPLSDAARAAADKLVRIAEQLIPAGEGNLFETWSCADADLAFMLHRLILNHDPIPERIRRYASAQWQRPSVRAFVEHERPLHSAI